MAETLLGADWQQVSSSLPPDGMMSLNGHEVPPQQRRKKKQRKTNVDVTRNVPTNREQFTNIYNLFAQMQQYVNISEARTARMENEINTLKAIIALMDYQNLPANSVTNDQLAKLFEAKATICAAYMRHDV